MDLNLLKKNLCESFCRDIAVKQLSDHTVLMSLPTTDRDGDGFSVYLQETTPGFRLSDGGNTLMRLSYDADIKTLLKGTRKSVFDLILSESGVYEEDGEIYKDIAPQQLIPELFNITKAMTRVSDLSLLNKKRIASTFYDDVRNAVFASVQVSRIKEEYILPNVDQGDKYPIDFYIEANTPLFVFGANSGDKIKLSTIFIQHFKSLGINFNSLIVLSNAEELPRKDLTRLQKVADNIAPMIDDKENIKSKIIKMVA